MNTVIAKLRCFMIAAVLSAPANSQTWNPMDSLYPGGGGLNQTWRPRIEAPPPDSVPITLSNGQISVEATMGRIKQSMLLDTGAGLMQINLATAEALVAQREAQWIGTQRVCMADGRCVSLPTVLIAGVWIGGHGFLAVRATVSEGPAIIPLSIINQSGRFTIDTAKGLLIFG
jgi:hypothetical protein